MLAVHFGAGNIGRGFIGWLLARSGYDVCFVDVNPDLVRLIQERRSYTVRLLGEQVTEERVEGITAIDGRDPAVVARAIAEADLVTTSVGPNILVHIAPAIAAGLRLRGDRPVNLIACENMVGSGDALRRAVAEHLGGAPLNAGFPNAVVDRIVPNFRPAAGEDPLLIAVESYFEWLVDAAGFVGPAPVVTGMRPVHNLPAYTERKLFGLNTGHAVVAYLGYLRRHTYIHEAVRDPLVRASLLSIFVEAGMALVLEHGFTEAEQAQYAARILQRFENSALGDLVVRVGRDPLRKLAPQDRLVAPARMALRHGIIPRTLARGIAAGYLFAPAEDSAAATLQERVREQGLADALVAVSGIDPADDLGRLVQQEYEMLQKTGVQVQ